VALADRLRARARRLWRRVFPPEAPVPEEVRRLVAAVYPTLDLGAVSFHRGLPHLLSLMDSQGMAVPAVLSPRRSRIYIHPRYWDTATAEGLGLFLHEAFHALQIQEAGPGLGVLRPFTILYLACAGGCGFLYHRHPMELDAYRVAGRRRSLFECAFRADPAGLMPEVATSGLGFWRRLAASTPLARGLAGVAWRARSGSPAGSALATASLAAATPLVVLWLTVWTLAAGILWLARLVVEATGALAAALLWGLSVLLRPFGRRR
jgi:hypothetical protein